MATCEACAWTKLRLAVDKHENWLKIEYISGSLKCKTISMYHKGLCTINNYSSCRCVEQTAKHQTIGRVFSKDYGEVACRCTYLNISRQSYTYREPKPAGHFTNNTHTHKHTYQLTTAMESRTVFCETGNWTYIPISNPIEQNRASLRKQNLLQMYLSTSVWHTHAQSRMSQARLCCAYKYSKHFLWSAWWSSQALDQ